ncbi:hypothetical protein BDV95DRAFT_580812 [Massariosphaeria phaeospora]|uniref:Inner kinetochore subunit AME1 domain-containing protein n=1 Tax=Massariosphaeria phaeospora TaxID=100035 RepID=A0A7C8M3P0_9PLEO|nr:hypothetical protein BDV95DRAFT_580812 [Massariosphaeria phaeospora]
MDRHERRQQRVRGAGASAVQASFGFNFGALAAQPPKQASLPPQRSSRRTPDQSTARGQPASTQRAWSVSVQRSSAVKERNTSTQIAVTPHLGKRKRGSKHAQAESDDDGELDDLSPDRDDNTRSIEKSRKVAATISPIAEQADELPDELSMVDQVMSSAQRVSKPAQEAMELSIGGLPQNTPLAVRKADISPKSVEHVGRRSRSTDPGPATPGLLPRSRLHTSSALRSRPDLATPKVSQDAEESEDELSPPQPPNTATPRIVSVKHSPPIALADESMDVDELSSPVQPSLINSTPQQKTSKQAKQPQITQNSTSAKNQTPSSRPTRQARQRRVVEDGEEGEDLVHTTPAATRPRQTQRKSTDADETIDDGEVDEISPESERTRQRLSNPVPREDNARHISSGRESEQYEESGQEEEALHLTPRPVIAKRISPKRNPRAKLQSNEPPQKRQKRGPTQAIAVMRLKGSSVRGLTVADTTRTIIESNLDHRLTRLAEKMENVRDPARKKEMRGQIMLALSFKDSLSEKLLDIQDANDTLTAGFAKLKVFKKSNGEIRKQILAFQNSRQEIALEFDEIQAEFDHEKHTVETRTKLSSNMFDIQAAIHEGRERARNQGRDNEGPDIPLSMLLETVSKDVFGSYGGGLLAGVQGFNGMLEKSAGWLEGRA